MSGAWISLAGCKSTMEALAILCKTQEMKSGQTHYGKKKKKKIDQ